ncbi:MAG: hypothetical protein P4M08_10625 [Oligoflexia bacterium]|nr:hypothetical protein [Oligoflexia bacterium]
MELGALLGTLIGLIFFLMGFAADGMGGLVFFGIVAGATLLSYPFADIRQAFKSIFGVYKKLNTNAAPVIEEIVRVAAVARKEGVLAMEGSRASIRDPLLKKAIKYVVDGLDGPSVREILIAEIQMGADQDLAAASVFEGMGAIAPWIGVLASLFDLSHGAKLAGALTPLLLGLGSAHVFFIPWSKKLKRQIQQSRSMKEVVQLGIAGIQDGLNPHFIQARLSLFASALRK